MYKALFSRTIALFYCFPGHNWNFTSKIYVPNFLKQKTMASAMVHDKSKGVELWRTCPRETATPGYMPNPPRKKNQ
jgi:hypothetical protein